MAAQALLDDLGSEWSPPAPPGPDLDAILAAAGLPVSKKAIAAAEESARLDREAAAARRKRSHGPDNVRRHKIDAMKR